VDGGTISATGVCTLQQVGTVIDTRRSEPIEPFSPKFKVDPGLPQDAVLSEWTDMMRIYSQRQTPLEIRAWRIPDCIVVPPHMLLVSKSGELIAESIRKRAIPARNPAFTHLVEDNVSVSQASDIPFTRMSKEVFALGVSQHLNYYHWMIESIPRLDWLSAQNNLPVLLANPRRKYHTQSIEYLHPPSLEPICISQPTMFDQLVFVEFLAKSNVRLSPLIRDFYRAHSPNSGPRRRRLLVSRADAGIRRIVNEPDLMQALSWLDFELVQLTPMSVEEQAMLFAEAEIVVGPHGAGFANLCFCQKGTRVLEFVPSSFHEGITSFAALSDMFELDYTMCVCQATHPQLGANTNLTVDVAHAVQLLGEFCGARQD
jgi:capsular polysaccharide biosynthesis protein